MKEPLHRYWIEFDLTIDDPRSVTGLMLGCGVTAYTRDDALYLVRSRVLHGEALPPIKSIVEDVDVSMLDQGHVMPNIWPPIWRGVWFPPSYREPE